MKLDTFRPMKRSLLERAKLARRISETPTDPPWEQFRRDWTAFNLIYTGTKRSGDSEDGMVQGWAGTENGR